jgi:hypothetical protein
VKITTALYRSIMLAVERRRLALGWPMWLVDERSGVQSGYYAKILHAETISGRNAGWEVLQWVIDALWPDGIGVRFNGEPIPDVETMREKIRAMREGYAQERAPTHLRSYTSARAFRP